MLYEVLYYDGWGTTPAYYVLDGVKGDTPEQALATNLKQVTQQARDLLGLPKGAMPDKTIQETIYVLRENGLVSMRDPERLSE